MIITILNVKMNRTEGLVQRRNINKDNNSDGALKENHDIDDKKNDKNYDDGDSKETRLTLMEEVLLLGLKDKEVCFYAWINNIEHHVNSALFMFGGRFRVTHRFGMIAYLVV